MADDKAKVLNDHLDGDLALLVATRTLEDLLGKHQLDVRDQYRLQHAVTLCNNILLLSLGERVEGDSRRRLNRATHHWESKLLHQIEVERLLGDDETLVINVSVITHDAACVTARGGREQRGYNGHQGCACKRDRRTSIVN